MYLTTDRSCDINTYVSPIHGQNEANNPRRRYPVARESARGLQVPPILRCRSLSRLIICACIDTSSADTGSSQMTSLGLTACKFHTRCSKCMDVCKFKAPETVEARRGHFVACHLYNEQVMSKLDEYSQEYARLEGSGAGTAEKSACVYGCNGFSKISSVSENSIELPRLTIGQIISEPVAVHKIVPKSEIYDYVQGVMKQCGLQPQYYDRYPHEFSGGQRQRICIARALAVKATGYRLRGLFASF